MNGIGVYKAFRPEMQTGDRIEWRTRSVLGTLIRFCGKCSRNHTAMVLRLPYWQAPPDVRLLYLHTDRPMPDLDHVFIMQAVSGGVQLALLSREIEDTRGEVYWAPLKATDEQRTAMARWTLEQTGIGYDFGSLFWNIVAHVSMDARKLFCSELYFGAMKEAGLASGKKAPRPGEFGQFDVFDTEVKIL